VAVLVNGFGSITIDADLVVGVDGNVIVSRLTLLINAGQRGISLRLKGAR